jgi:hypothetical protein
MAYPQIYLGQAPAGATARRALRERALELHAALQATRAPAPTYALLNFAADAGPDAARAPQLVDLLLLRPNAAIVAVLRTNPDPIVVTPDGHWSDAITGATIRDQRGWSPLQVARAQRDIVRDRLHQHTAALLGLPAGAQPFERMVGALICDPTTHPASRISLDVDDHRQWLKVLGLDELAGLAAMLRIGTQLSEEVMRRIVGELFGGRLWHDGERLLFELALGRFQLRVLAADDGQEAILPLIEGENVVGRRRTARRNERRVTLSGDDLISSDHAQIICDDDNQVTLRDTSKNGTWLTLPDGAEERLHGEARAIEPGALLRMGVTRMLLERVGK